MAQWRSLLTLEPDLKSRVVRLYVRKFPFDIRRCLSLWIEEQDWEAASADGAAAKRLFQTVLLKLDELIRESLYNNHTLKGPDFSLLKDHLMTQFEHFPQDMAVKLSECLQEEKLLLESASVVQVRQPDDAGVDDEASQLENQIREIEEEVKALEKVESIYKSWESGVAQMNGPASAQMQEKCLNQANSIRTKKQEVMSRIVKSVKLASLGVESLVSVELPEWKRKQQMSCIGNPVRIDLERLETRFSRVAQSLLQIVQQLKKLQEQSRPQISPVSNLSEVIQQTNSLLNKLMKNALVVEKQPVMHNQPRRPLVLRTTVLFSVKLRFLVNLPSLLSGCSIQAEFDKDVQEVETIQGFRQFQFTSNNTKVMDIDKQKGGLVAEWDMSIMEIKVKRKRSNVSPIRVTEELHLIKFSTNLQFAGLECRVETSSLPLVVVSTTSQSSSAWASVLWYNLCPPQDTSLSVFVKPPPLSWELLSQALSWQFISAGDQELNDDQLHELKLKIVDNPEELVSWSKFSNQKDGPWIWIDGILGLIEQHVKTLWRENLIMGFVSKNQTRQLLQNKQSGTFLLRFSESNREGAITFSWVEHTNKGVIFHDIAPFTKDELSRKSLADSIKTFRKKNGLDNPLIYLYPATPKDSAFGRYYSNSNEMANNLIVAPYVKKIFVCVGE
ncbi:signal transducer and activator of transcription 1-alpha/beta-like [Eucyclogobius newberryi]|uniref:signal transducer and activator of transcription 1-alpha/beta-like n=1 Tax=Eucyclogobius newberryi TaxID=166745 RepID=UPI003B59CC43